VNTSYSSPSHPSFRPGTAQLHRSLTAGGEGSDGPGSLDCFQPSPASRGGTAAQSAGARAGMRVVCVPVYDSGHLQSPGSLVGRGEAGALFAGAVQVPKGGGCGTTFWARETVSACFGTDAAKVYSSARAMVFLLRCRLHAGPVLHFTEQPGPAQVSIHSVPAGPTGLPAPGHQPALRGAGRRQSGTLRCFRAPCPSVAGHTCHKEESGVCVVDEMRNILSPRFVPCSHPTHTSKERTHRYSCDLCSNAQSLLGSVGSSSDIWSKLRRPKAHAIGSSSREGETKRLFGTSSGTRWPGSPLLERTPYPTHHLKGFLREPSCPPPPMLHNVCMCACMLSGGTGRLPSEHVVQPHPIPDGDHWADRATDF
jgi:hypothetical protein